MRKRHVLSVLFIAALPALTCQAAGQTYRWTDTEGNPQYGDTLPSGVAERGYQVVDPSTGEVIREITPRKTAAEKARDQAERAAREKARREAEDRARQDRILLALYSRVEDIERARDERLDRIDGRIQSLTLSIERIRQRAEEGLDGADSEAELHNLLDAREQLKTEREAIEAEFAEDIRRFRELKHLD